MTPDQLKQTIREIPDFPRPGIKFYDVSTLFRDAEALATVVRGMGAAIRPMRPDVLLGIEARGFILGAAIAYEMGLGLVIARKFGKLPGETEGEAYELEYGEAHIEIHRGAIGAGDRVVLVDDLLATGGTAAAAGRLVERLGASLTAHAFMVELGFLGGRQRLEPTEVYSMLCYD